MKIFLIVLILVAVIVGRYIFYTTYPPVSNQTSQTTQKLVGEANYLCKDNKTLEAKYYAGPRLAVQPGEPPIPNGHVDLVLSDGRAFTLPQTISADGIRYANPDESFVFWSKGNGALVLEHNTDQTYIGCVALTPDLGGLPQTFVDSAGTFSIRYPENYSVNTTYKYSELGPGKEISGVKFTIPQEMASGTNLSSYDTGVSVETIPAVQDCNATLFLDQNIKAQTVTDSNTEYSFASSTGTAAGNRYEERVWTIPGANPCIAVRYLIHYGVIQNYPPGAVREFDENALLQQFDAIRKTLIVN